MKMLVAAVRRHIRQTGKSLRTLEFELGWGHGTLGNILRGRSEIRLYHVESLARVLGLKPIDLLREVYDDSTEAQPLDLRAWLSAHEPQGWRGMRTAYRSGARARLAGEDSTSTSYREGDRFFVHFQSGFKAMDEALQSGAVFSCPSCGQPLSASPSTDQPA